MKFGSAVAPLRPAGLRLRLATGHLRPGSPEPTDEWAGPLELRRGVDAAKDQSYVLSMLGQGELACVLFPVGEMTKHEVREHAQRLGLRTAMKPDSQDVCFISSAEGRQGFFEGRLELHPGEVVDAEGNPAGTVEAVELVTVGQRRGMGHGGDGKRRYVTHVDVATRRVTVGGADAVARSSVFLPGPSVTWVDVPLVGGARAVAQVSAHGRPIPCTVDARQTPSGVGWWSGSTFPSGRWPRGRPSPFTTPATPTSWSAQGSPPDHGRHRLARQRRRNRLDRPRRRQRSCGRSSGTTTSCTTCSTRPRSPTPSTTSWSSSCASSNRTTRTSPHPTRRRRWWARPRRRASSRRSATGRR